MKKLVYILLIIVSTACSSLGGYETPKYYMVVGDIESYTGYCIYIGKNSNEDINSNILGNWYPAIADSCGKWNIDDTIKFY